MEEFDEDEDGELRFLRQTQGASVFLTHFSTLTGTLSVTGSGGTNLNGSDQKTPFRTALSILLYVLPPYVRKVPLLIA